LLRKRKGRLAPPRVLLVLAKLAETFARYV
jgi:hypothetical protein